ncbi:MAG: glycosyltransferase [Verrucomicrobiae bacterium]
MEHIIQDAGSSGIEDFAREVGADFYRDGVLCFRGQNGSEETQSAESPCSTRIDNPESSIQNPNSPYRLSVYSESDSGMYDAINRGLARSTGEICAWLNSDEQYLVGTLQKAATIFASRPNLDVLLGDALLTNSEHKPVCYRRTMVPSLWHTRLDHLHSLSCAMFFRPSALPTPPLDSRWKVIGDGLLMVYFLRERKVIYSCNELFSAYAFTGANLSAERVALEEFHRWWREDGWPPRFFRVFVVLQNRLRRMWHGAYRTFDVNAALYTRVPALRREQIRCRVSGFWPQS